MVSRELADGLNPPQLIPSPPLLGSLAEPFRGLEPFDAVRRMSEMVYREYEYQSGVTDVTSVLEQVIRCSAESA